jgi:hypothetical protein
MPRINGLKMKQKRVEYKIAKGNEIIKGQKLKYDKNVRHGGNESTSIEHRKRLQF